MKLNPQFKIELDQVKGELLKFSNQNQKNPECMQPQGETSTTVHELKKNTDSLKDLKEPSI